VVQLLTGIWPRTYAVDVVLGFDDLDSYASQSPFFGCVVGRHAGRLEPQFTIDGEAYKVAGSDGGGGGIDVRTNLHGGTVGWDKRVWKVIAQGTAADSASVTFAYTSPHLEEGFPGEVQAELTYRLTTGGELHLEYAASVDRPTIVSMTNHTCACTRTSHALVDPVTAETLHHTGVSDRISVRFSKPRVPV
jgi:aldose 1-epimerase